MIRHAPSSSSLSLSASILLLLACFCSRCCVQLTQAVPLFIEFLGETMLSSKECNTQTATLFNGPEIAYYYDPDPASCIKKDISSTESTSVCDLSNRNINFKSNCTKLGGKFYTADLTFNLSELNTGKKLDGRLSNFGICIASSCTNSDASAIFEVFIKIEVTGAQQNGFTAQGSISESRLK